MLGSSSTPVIQTQSPKFYELPLSYKITAEEVQHGSGALTFQKKLQRAKYTNRVQKLERARARAAMTDDEEVDIFYIEDIMKENSIRKATNVDDMERRYREQMRYRYQLRDFYYAKGRSNQRYAYELTIKRYVDRLCSRERCDSKIFKNNYLIMFIGDRGEGVGSRMKGFLKYGGKWKPNIHSRYTTVCITNEYNTSQTCLFCYNKLLHPKKVLIKKDGSKFIKSINGSSYCVNNICPLVQQQRAIQPRDRLRSLAIAISGFSTLVFGEAVPPFNHKFNDNTEKFITLANTFLNKEHEE